MSPSSQLLTKEQFSKWVHSALGRLYDAPYLQGHPLAKMLLGEEAQNPLARGQNLRRVLLDAIQALQPEPGRPALSPDWRAYRILELRYIEGLSLDEVMTELAVGKSQFFRDQARILETLVDILWNQRRETVAAPGSAGSEEASQHQVIQAETGRLVTSANWEVLEVVSILNDLGPIVFPLASSRGARIQVDPSAAIRVHADRIMVRQALLNLITHALAITQNKEVAISGQAGDKEVRLCVRTQILGTLSAHPPYPGLEICAHLMTAMGGDLRLDETAPDWQAVLAWPETEPRSLLIVDDNDELITLFRRYLAGQDWLVRWANCGAEARQRIMETKPTVIMLDVMMPEEDGWEILVSLKTNEATRNIPIIICSVAQELQLAESLGASGYLPKPVSQADLVKALAPYSTPVPGR